MPHPNPWPAQQDVTFNNNGNTTANRYASSSSTGSNTDVSFEAPSTYTEASVQVNSASTDETVRAHSTNNGSYVQSHSSIADGRLGISLPDGWRSFPYHYSSVEERTPPQLSYRQPRMRQTLRGPLNHGHYTTHDAGLATTHENGGFLPMHNVNPTVPSPLEQLLGAQIRILQNGTSTRYRGNPWLLANQSAPIPDELNTALWLTNLPPDCTYDKLLPAVRNCGKVYATVINPPEASKNHITAACKLVFFDVSGAKNLLRQAREGAFTVGWYVPQVRHNRIRSAARQPGPQSRVLHIEGPDCIVNERFLVPFFDSKFSYELEGVFTLSHQGMRTRQEWRFGSFRCQADSARTSIAREKERTDMLPEEWAAWQSVTVYFAVDPCAPSAQ